MTTLPFQPATDAWFRASFGGPTPVQASGWPLIARGAHSLLLAPTGSGKTLAAFLWALDRACHRRDDEPGYRVVYVSPMKALAYDVERNLRAPLVGIQHAAVGLKAEIKPVKVDVRTGDTPQRERQRMLRKPGHVLVTTPESLYLMLGSKVRERLRSVQVVIVDEIHALAGTKRGAHLALSLERLSALAHVDPQRVGLSATARPVADVAAFLGGDRQVEVVDTREAPNLKLEVTLPSAMASEEVEQDETDEETWSDEGLADGGWADEDLFTPPRRRGRRWPAMAPTLLPRVLDKRASIVFVNSRGAAERLVQQLHELNGEEFALAHHGSLSHTRRAEVEDQLKSGDAKAIVATSSLELGVDMGAVDQVVLIGSPGRVANGLQRIGRAGHGVGEQSFGVMLPRSPRDQLECVVIAQMMREGEIEPVRPPQNPLDVLAQQVVAMVAVEEVSLDDLGRLVRRAHSFQKISDSQLHGVLDMLSGRYPSTDFAELRPLVDWDRAQGLLTARRGAKRVAATHGGTIPDRGLFGVHIVDGLGGRGPRIGELDEEMVFEARAGQTFVLGTSTWRIEDITRDRVLVTPAPGEPGTLPFWHGTRPGRPLAIGKRMGFVAQELAARAPDDAQRWLSSHAPASAPLNEAVVAMVHEQKRATKVVPSATNIVVERFLDELGDLRVCIHSPFGARVHAPWAMALEAELGRMSGVVVQTMWSDDGIALTLADTETDPWADAPENWTPDPDQLEELVIERLGETALFAGQFRENASRALLLLKRSPGRRAPLWAQRLRAQRLLAAARQHPSFPMVLETYRSCLQDVFDMTAAREVLAGIQRRDIIVHVVDTDVASPFARSLAFEFVATWLYEGDAPVAERRAQALTLDRELLRDLLGHAELRDLLDAEAIDEVEAELQCSAEGFQARDEHELLDTLRRVGDLTADEVTARCAADPTKWLQRLRERNEAVVVQVAGERRWIAASDAGRYGQGLGVIAPPGLPLAYLEPVSDPMRDLVTRFAKRRGPFTLAQIARRFGLPPAQLMAQLANLVASRKLLEGEFSPGGIERQWCDEGVLRRIRRRTLAKVKASIAPAAAEAYALFLAEWHKLVDGPQMSLEEALIQLEGLPLPVSELERRILPARVRGYTPERLDRLLSQGQWVWVGHSSLGPRDGRVQLFRRERLSTLWSPPDQLQPPTGARGEALTALRAHLERYGASFLFELSEACQPLGTEELRQALFDLVWAGEITNDSFAPLRALQRPVGRGRRRRAPLAGGRWSPLRVFHTPSATERAVAWAQQALARHGVVARESLHIEAAPGGYASLRKVFRELDERGRARRGYFVEGLSGAQIALVGAVDRLRERRERDAVVLALAATDPAQPYGRMLPWPEPAVTPPRVTPQTTVVSVNGAPFFALTGKSGHLKTLGPARACEDEEVMIQALTALRRQHPTPEVLLEKVDGQPVAKSALVTALKRAGFGRDPRGWVSTLR